MALMTDTALECREISLLLLNAMFKFKRLILNTFCCVQDDDDVL